MLSDRRLNRSYWRLSIVMQSTTSRQPLIELFWIISYSLVLISLWFSPLVLWFRRIEIKSCILILRTVARASPKSRLKWFRNSDRSPCWSRKIAPNSHSLLFPHPTIIYPIFQHLSYLKNVIQGKIWLLIYWWNNSNWIDTVHLELPLESSNFWVYILICIGLYIPSLRTLFHIQQIRNLLVSFH